MRVGIIGGGAAGLAAAYELGLRGHVVEVFEGAPFLGGQASTFLVGGTPVERGYHHLFQCISTRLGSLDHRRSQYRRGQQPRRPHHVSHYFASPCPQSMDLFEPPFAGGWLCSGGAQVIDL